MKSSAATLRRMYHRFGRTGLEGRQGQMRGHIGHDHLALETNVAQVAIAELPQGRDRAAAFMQPAHER
jgi:hypothetical protein